jgi:hypothetical protein
MYVLDVGFSGRKAERRALIIYHWVWQERTRPTIQPNYWE